jgi:erythromycin esterase
MASWIILTLGLGAMAGDVRVDDLKDRAIPLAETWGPRERAALRTAVGESRVVLLGELTHGDGTAFRQKVEIVKALHESLGFDVLIWESGLYDCVEMDAALGGAGDLADVARMGVFGHWSQAVESFPVFEYARARRATDRPLEMAGFDLQGSGTASNSLFPDMLDWFGDRPELTAEDRAAVAASFDLARAAAQAADPQAAMQEAERAVYATAARFVRAFEANPALFRTRWGDAAALRETVMRNAVQYGAMLEQHRELREGRRAFADPYNLRERANAATLLWLVNERYRGRKVIVWGHNLHVLRTQPTSGRRRAPAAGELESTGRIVGEALGDDAYSLGFVAADGAWSWLGNPPIAYRTPGVGSIEALWRETGRPLAFLDLRALPADHWLRGPIAATLDQQNPLTVTAPIPEAFDGLIFIASMAPRTQRP